MAKGEKTTERQYGERLVLELERSTQLLPNVAMRRCKRTDGTVSFYAPALDGLWRLASEMIDSGASSPETAS